MRNIVLSMMVLSLVLAGAIPASAWNIPAPQDYGKVIISNFSQKAGMQPVRFDHWLHRSLYTCRLCHVDIGFAMEANATEITSEANRKGLYCGVCHDGMKTYNGKKIFAPCSQGERKAEEMTRCNRCHSVGSAEKTRELDYATFTEKFPKRAFGKLIDWEKAESEGFIQPVDFLEGISFRRPALNAEKDFSITAKTTWMQNIIFSHKKHVIWNGCEVCHPDIFPSVRKGKLKYTMFEIAEGKYCGVCHNRVAFPLNECERCHIDPVGQ